MHQDCNLGLDLLSATPSVAIDAQIIGLIAAGLDLVGVVEPTRVQTTATDWSQSIRRQHLLDQGIGAQVGIRDGKHAKIVQL